MTNIRIAVSFSISPAWAKKLTEYKKKGKIQVRYFDMETLETRETEMFVERFQAKLETITSYKRLWNVWFARKEF